MSQGRDRDEIANRDLPRLPGDIDPHWPRAEHDIRVLFKMLSTFQILSKVTGKVI